MSTVMDAAYRFKYMVRFEPGERSLPLLFACGAVCSVITVLVHFAFLEGKQSLSCAFTAAGDGNCNLNRKGHMHEGGKRKGELLSFTRIPPPPIPHCCQKIKMKR